MPVMSIGRITRFGTMETELGARARSSRQPKLHLNRLMPYAALPPLDDAGRCERGGFWIP
jgi:hypothetical protein